MIKIKFFLWTALVVLVLFALYYYSDYQRKNWKDNNKSELIDVTGTDLYKEGNSNCLKGQDYYEIGNYEEALKYLKIGLDEEIKEYGENHIKIAQIQHAIGNIYLEINQIDIAQQWFEDALEICLSLTGDEKYSATIYSDLGHTYKGKKLYEKALEYFNIALEIDNKYGKGKTRDCALGYSNIAKVYFELEDYEKALEYYNKELSIYQSNPKIGLEDLAICYHDIGITYSQLDEYNSALKYYQLAQPIYQITWGISSPRWANINTSLSSLYYSTGHYEKSLEYLNVAANIYEQNPFSFNYDLAYTYDLLSWTYEKMLNIDQAIKYGKKAYETIDKNNPYNYDAINTLKSNLTVLYTKTGNDLNELNRWFALH